MTRSSTRSTAPATSTDRRRPATAPGAAGAMDQSDFLRLMTTQLTTQDPFNPVDNTQMVAQMAQFSPGRRHRRDEPEPAARSPRRSAAAGSPTRASWIGRSMLVEVRRRDAAARRHLCRRVHAARAAPTRSPSASSTRTAPSSTPRSSAPQARATIAFAWDGKNEAGEHVAGGPLRIVVDRHRDGQSAAAPATATWTLDRRHPVAGRRRRQPPRHRPRPARARRRHPPRLTLQAQGALPCPSTPRSPAFAARRPTLSTISNNIANVGSIGFKRSRAEFGDIMPASTHDRRPGHAPQGDRAAVHAGRLRDLGRASSTSRSAASGFFVHPRRADRRHHLFHAQRLALRSTAERYLVDSQRRLSSRSCRSTPRATSTRPASPRRATSSCR